MVQDLRDIHVNQIPEVALELRLVDLDDVPSPALGARICFAAAELRFGF